MLDTAKEIARPFKELVTGSGRSISLDNKPLRKIVFDGESKAILVMIIFSQLFLNNGWYLFLCLGTLFLLFYYLQQPLKPTVFTLILLNHFLQIITAVWQANYVGQGVNYRTPYMSEAIVASLVGMVFLFFPIIYFQSKLPVLSWNDLKREAYKLSTGNTFNCYLASYFLASFLGLNALSYGGFAQIVISLVKIKWCFFLLFGYQSILKKEKRNLFYVFVIIEFLSGFFSFFSEFKTVIYFLLVLLLGLLQVINIKKVIYGAIIGGCAVLFALVWTGIKGKFRSYVNGGTRQQVVNVSNQQALDKIYDLSSNVKEDDLNSSTYDLLDRLQYVFHFAKTIQRVPSVIPFQGGRNWLDNIEFVTTPRLLNPDKPTVDATEKTRKYTGLAYSGKQGGASFSLGYFAECYLDFGIWGMMIPLALIGLMYGLTFWYFMRKSSSNYIFNYCVVGAFFLEFFAFEIDGTILLGRFLATLVTFLLLKRFFFPWVMNYISVPLKKSLPSSG